MRTIRFLLFGFVTLAMVTFSGCGADEQAAVGTGNASRGQGVYDKRCSQCHGADGDGDGPGALFMYPRPRAFKDNSSYKFRSTKGLPSDADLFRVISEGIPGTSMPGFDVLPEQERWDLVAFIKSLSSDFRDPESLEDAVPFEELANAKAPELQEGGLEQGKKIYEEQKCWQCHGKSGLGNGESWPELYFRKGMDDDGKVSKYQKRVFPGNLANPESFRNGSTVEDIFRTITTGVSPMPNYRDSLSVEQRWQLSHYVRSLGPAPKEQRDETIVAIRAETLPEGADDESWADAPVARFQTIANVIEPPRLFWQSVEYVNAQAMYNEDSVVLRIQWDDRTESKGSNTAKTYSDWDTKLYMGTDHPDQMAVQFPSKLDPKKRPYFMLGWTKASVNLWWWRGDTGTLVERNAKGHTSISEQSERSQALKGAVSYADGRYTMVVRRPLTTANTKGDIQFSTGVFVPISFHIWDGHHGEVGQRRALTTWNWLYLKPEVPEDIYHLPAALFIVVFLFLLGLVHYIRKTHAREDPAAPQASADEG
jgi:DMSO reductase family type II enzyme heme b subunit